MPSDIVDETFLWNQRLGNPATHRWPVRTGLWWTRFSSRLEQAGSLSAAALSELSASTRTICALLPSPQSWSGGKQVKAGLVVGAVQSGKTQHMMGTTARAFDNGYRIAVVLAGQTNDLRMQTARRFNGQLADYNEEVSGHPGRTTLGGQLGARSQPESFCLPYSADSHEYNLLGIKLRRELQRGGYAILVIKKHPLSIAKVGEVIRTATTAADVTDVPILVLDDECDEASVPANAQETVVPDAILGLLSAPGDNLRIAYLGYTATAAANLLQHPESGLYPDVVHLLRAPGAGSSAFTFTDPDPDRWYCGGHTYFEEFGDEPDDDGNFLLATTVSQEDLAGDAAANESFHNALRSYFVSGAFRLCLEGDVDAVLAHSMMVHTSPTMEEHNRYALAIRERYGFMDPERRDQFDADKLRRDLEEKPVAWRKWYDSYTTTRNRIHDMRPHRAPFQPVSWEQVRAVLPATFARTRLKIVNSDDLNSDRLDFSPSFDSSGRRVDPADQFVVAIGGARLSRGITIEGLATSYFGRDAVIRFEDALLQMNRWFGYRSGMLEFCRIITSEKAFNDLRSMHENDGLLRSQLHELMVKQASPKEAALVFRSSPYSKPTAKVGAGREVMVSFSPLVRVLNQASTRDYASDNLEATARLVERILRRNPRQVRSGNGNLQGVVSEGWSVEEVAAILDSLQFDAHNPRPHPELHGDFHKPLDESRPARRTMPPQRDPYLISAYLRAWVQAPGDVGPPTFNVAISYGSQPSDPPAFPFPLVNRQITPDGEMLGGWTGRGQEPQDWPGDIFFDLYGPGFVPREKHRPAGERGLLLLYLVHKKATGRRGTGTQRLYHTPYLGVSIPAGGPREWRVISPGGGTLLADH